MQLVKDVLPKSLQLITVFNDNQGAIALAKNPINHFKSKHIDIRYHYVREYLNRNNVPLNYVPSNENYADVFTKPPRKEMLKNFRSYIFG